MRVFVSFNLSAANYAAGTVVMFIAQILTSPLMMIFIAAAAGSWYYLLHLRKEPVVISGHTLTPQQLVYALSGGTTAMALLMGLGDTLIWSIVLSAILFGAHGACYNREEEEGEFEKDILMDKMTGP